VTIPFMDQDKRHPAEDGIFVTDVDSGESRLLISLDQIVRVNPRREFSQSLHYFNHLQFNPTGSRFAFYHRWTRDRRRKDTHVYGES
jgi:hypothetical protein